MATVVKTVLCDCLDCSTAIAEAEGALVIYATTSYTADLKDIISYEKPINDIDSLDGELVACSVPCALKILSKRMEERFREAG